MIAPGLRLTLEERNVGDGARYCRRFLSDERDDGNQLRAVLGRRTKRTSVPSIFIDGVYIGGMNDGSPGLGPLAERSSLQRAICLDV